MLTIPQLQTQALISKRRSVEAACIFGWRRRKTTVQKLPFSVLARTLDPSFHEDVVVKNAFFERFFLLFSTVFKQEVCQTLTREGGRMMNPDGSLRQRHVSQPVTQPVSESSWYEDENVRKRMERRQRERQVFCEVYSTNTRHAMHGLRTHTSGGY